MEYAWTVSLWSFIFWVKYKFEFLVLCVYCSGIRFGEDQLCCKTQISSWNSLWYINIYTHTYTIYTYMKTTYVPRINISYTRTISLYFQHSSIIIIWKLHSRYAVRCGMCVSVSFCPSLHHFPVRNINHVSRTPKRTVAFLPRFAWICLCMNCLYIQMHIRLYARLKQ